MAENKKKKSSSRSASKKSGSSQKKTSTKNAKRTEEVKTKNNSQNKTSKKTTKSSTPARSTSTKKKSNGSGATIGKAIVFIVVAILIVLLLLKGCNKGEYTVKFDSTGGSSISSMTTDENGNIKKPDDPVREGYVFEYWYLEGEDEPFDFNQKITSDMKLLAKWHAISDDVELKGISIEKTLTLKPGSESTLNVTLDPSDATGVELVWSSSDNSIVKVDQKGKVTAVKKGKATITVQTSDGKFKATCTVTVSEKVVDVSKIVLDKHDITIYVGKSANVGYKITPTNASDKGVTWKSDNKNIATVDKYGNIVGVKVGTTTITVTTNSGKKTDKLTVRVKDNSTKEVPVTSVKISGKTEVQVGSSITLTATITPSNATDKSVTWSVKNGTGSATIDKKTGKLTGTKAGTVTVTVTTSNGKTHSVVITVKEKPASYVLVLTPNRMANGNFVSYSVSVTKNGQAFTGFKKINFGNGISPKTTNIASSAVTADTNGKTYTITLTDGSTASITVDVKK